MRQAEILVLSTQITESVPAIPGLAALILLLPLNALLRRWGRFRPLARGEMIVIFLFVCVSSAVMGVGVTQFLFALLTTPFYFKEDGIPNSRPYLPRWLAPHDPEVLRQLYERAPDGQVPWRVWIPPGLVWLAFFLTLWIALYCLMALFYRAWAEDERLAFPLVALPLELTGGDNGQGRFFRSPLMWAGFSAAACYNLINIAHAFNPAFFSFGKSFPIDEFFAAPPWDAIKPLVFHLRPELIGLGYLVSTEISLTVWVSYAVLKLSSVYAAGRGVTSGLMPYEKEQGIGAYLTLAVLLLWLSRRHLRNAWRGKANPSGEPSGGLEDGKVARRMIGGLLAGFAALWAFLVLAGMAGWVALLYLALVFAVALVYGRLRAETGVPLIWLFPFYMQKNALLYLFGSQPFLASGKATLPVWALFTFLARGYFPALTGYQVEAMEITRRLRLSAPRVALALVLAVGVGVAVGWFNHLTPYYQYGAQQLRGGIWGSWIAGPEYAAAAKYTVTPQRPDPPRIGAMFAGGCIVFLLWLCRLRFAGFAFHPLGYAMTCSYGSLIWSSFFIVWLLKSLALRWGGRQFYRASVPFFLGLALGHFATAGIFWGLIGAWSGDAVQGYPVFFG